LEWGKGCKAPPITTYTALQRAALLQMAWDYVASALDGRASAFALYASGGVPVWRGRLRRRFERYNALANAGLRTLNRDMPDFDLSSLREVPWAPRRTVTPPVYYYKLWFTMHNKAWTSHHA
jgi:hypothetical protein